MSYTRTPLGGVTWSSGTTIPFSLTNGLIAGAWIVCFAEVTNHHGDFSLPTDNGLGGSTNPWVQLGTTQMSGTAGNTSTAAWCKVVAPSEASGQAHAITQITINPNPTITNGVVGAEMISGWTGVPTVDLISGPAVSGSGASTESASASGTNKSTNEVAWAMTGSPLAITGVSGYYSPNFGTTQFSWTTQGGPYAYGSGLINTAWAVCTATGGISVWNYAWTSGGSAQAVIGVAVYDFIAGTTTDNAAFTDANADFRILGRTTTDTAASTDANVRTPTGFSRTTTDTAAFTETDQKADTLQRTTADTLHFTDTDVRAPIGFTRSSSDTMAFTDANARSPQTFTRTSSDVAHSTDADAKVVSFQRSTSDTAAFTDAAQKAPQGFIRTASDTAATTDAATRANPTLARTTSDTAAVVDTNVSVLGLITRTTTDTATATDFVAGIRVIARSASDSATFTDAAISGPNSFPRVVSDTLLLSDSTGRVLSFVRTTSDTAVSTDSNAIARGFFRTSSDTAAWTDAAHRIVSFQRTTSDNAVSTDSAHRTPTGYARVTSDIAVTTDSSNVSFISVQRSTADTLHTTDANVVVTHHGPHGTTSDNLAWTDSAIIRRSLDRTASDTASTSDSAHVRVTAAPTNVSVSISPTTIIYSTTQLYGSGPMPLISTYTAGDEIEFIANFVNASSGLPINPGKVIFAYSIGGGSVVQYEFPNTIINPEAGTFQISLDTTGWATEITGQVSVTYQWISSPNYVGGAVKAKTLIVNPAPLAVTFA